MRAATSTITLALVAAIACDAPDTASPGPTVKRDLYERFVYVTDDDFAAMLAACPVDEENDPQGGPYMLRHMDAPQWGGGANVRMELARDMNAEQTQCWRDEIEKRGGQTFAEAGVDTEHGAYGTTTAGSSTSG